MRNIIKSVIGILLISGILPSCHKETINSVQGVKLDDKEIQMVIGEQAFLAVTILPEDAVNKKVKWHSDKEIVATVTKEGVVEALNEGKAVITVTTDEGGFTDQCTVNVTRKKVPVIKITIENSLLVMHKGEETAIETIISPDNATDKRVLWSSDNEKIATVTDEGVVKARDLGTATITVTTVDQGKTAYCTVKVEKESEVKTGGVSYVTFCNALLEGQICSPIGSPEEMGYGILYSTSPGILIGNATMCEASKIDEDGNFTIETEFLEENTDYFYRSYVKRNGVVSYGDVKSFKTIPSSESFFIAVSSPDYQSATFNAALDLTLCKYSELEYGFIVTPEGGQPYKLAADNLAGAFYSLSVDDLKTGSKYKCRGYFRLDDHTYESADEEFTTLEAWANLSMKSTERTGHTATLEVTIDDIAPRLAIDSMTIYYSNSESTAQGLIASGTKIRIPLSSEKTATTKISCLNHNTKFYCMATAEVLDTLAQSSVTDFSTRKVIVPPGAVDLGLSVLWAEINITAKDNLGAGRYCQWGGTSSVGINDGDTFTDLSWSKCPYHSGSNYMSGWSKYVTNGQYGSIDNKSVLDPNDDPAHAVLGGDWRLPTKEEWEELVEKCYCHFYLYFVWEWETDRLGMLCESYIAGDYKSIFLPADGYRSGKQKIDGTSCYYWSSTVDGSNNHQAIGIRCIDNGIEGGSREDVSIEKFDRFWGCGIRAVCPVKYED